MGQGKKAYIMGAGEFGYFVCRQLLRYEDDWNILGFLDSDIHKKGTVKNGQKVYYLFDSEIANAGKETVIFIAITDGRAKQNVAYQLGRYGFYNVYEILNDVFWGNKMFVSFSNLDKRYVRQYKINTDNFIVPTLPYLETHIADGCNLKCKGCSHFANLFPTDAIVDFCQYEKDMVRMGEISDITRLRLLGGEPLLNTEILQYLKVARQVFPDTDIYVATNGILIPMCESNILQYMAENNIAFSITLYKTAASMKDQIVRRLGNNGVRYGLNENVGRFEKMLTLCGDKNPKENISICNRKICLTLKEGKLYRCAISAHVARYNERFQTAIESEALFDIYADLPEHLWKVSMEYPDKEVVTCKYCSNPAVEFPWEPSLNPVQEEWLV